MLDSDGRNLEIQLDDRIPRPFYLTPPIRRFNLTASGYFSRLADPCDCK